MANAYVEFGTLLSPVPVGSQVAGNSPIHFKCAASEVLAISASQANGAIVGGSGKTVARITTDDTACYLAIGTAPDCTLATASGASTARRYLPAARTIEIAMLSGWKVSVKAVS